MQKLGIYKQLIEQAFEPILIRLPNGVILDWNHGAEELYGYSAEQAVGAVSHDLLRTVFPASREEHDTHLVCNGHWTGELTHTTRDGRQVTVDSRQQLFTFGDGTQWVLESNRPVSAYRSRYRLLFGGMREGMAYCRMLYDDQGRAVDWVYLEANPALERMLGIANLTGRRASEVTPDLKETSPDILATCGHVARSGNPEVYEGYVPALRMWIRMSAFSPEPDHVVVIGDDVTNQMQTQTALRAAKERLDHLVSTSPMVTYSCKASGDFGATFVSNNVTQVLGYTPEEFTGDAGLWARNIHPDDAARVFADLQQVFDADRYSHEYRFRRKDGGYRWMRDELRVVRDEQGNPVEMIGVLTDVTARKSAEEALARSHAQMRSFVEHMPAAMAMLDRNLCYVAASRRWREDYRLGAQDLTGRHHYDVFPEIRNKPDWQAVHQRALAGATERSEGDRLIRQDGTENWLRWEVRPWRDLAGEIGGILIYTEDIAAQKQAQEALHESELRYRKVFEHAATGIAITDRDGRFRQCNPAYCRLLGYTEEELRQLEFASLVHPEDRAANLIETRRLKGGEQSFFEIINRYLRKDGAPVWVRKFVYTLPGETGAPAYMVALVTDISERMRTEAALTQERDYSRRIINTVPAIVLLLDARGYIQHVNPYFEQLSGYRLEEIRGKEWFATFLPERDRDRVRELFHHATGGEPTRGNVNAIVTRSGIEREIEWYDQRMTNMDGTFTALLAIGLDVTERRAAEQMRHEDATRLKLALDGADMGAWDWNIAADTSVWNAREHELFGFAPGEFSGATSEVLGRLHPQDRDRIAKALERAVAHNELYRDEFRVVHPDGTVRWLAGRAHPIRDAAGKVTRLIGVNYDITDRKNEELERERRHEDEMARLYRIGTVNELAGGLAHELSQPLTAIQNYAGGCLHWLDTHGEYGQLRHALAAINDQSARVVAIIQHLRSLITTGEPQRAPADVNTLVARARDLLKIPLARKNVTVTMELAPELPKAFIDALQIEQVVIILMRNCVDAFTGKYLARPAIVLCTTQSGPNSVEITVADNGPGVAPESLPRLFEPFYTTKPKGMGLGLMLAHSIVRAHNGSIRAERGSGGGLMVRITLPIDRGDQ